MSSGSHTYILYKTVVVGWDGFNVFNAVVEFCWVAIPIRLPKVEASTERCWLRNYYWLHANTDGAGLCVWDRVHDRLLTHVCDALRCEDEVWVVAFLPSRTVEWLRQFSIMNECKIARICPLFYRFSFVICVCVAPTYCSCWNLQSQYVVDICGPELGVQTGRLVACTQSVQQLQASQS